MSQTRQRPAALHRSRAPSADSEIQIVVVEDHPPLRQGLELLLAAQGFRMIGSAGCAEHGARMIRARRPDVAVVDIGLGDASGTDLAKTMAHEAPATAIVLYTGSINATVIDEAVNSGAGALVLKTSPLQHVADAIRAVASGHTYVDSAVASMSAGRPEGPGARRTSKREAQVLRLLASGCTTEQIAGTLFLSPETVQTHVRNATRKLGARGRLHAVILALINGEIDPPDTTR
ncbi:MAG: response regulator transcription factor [Solirubrobacteraceae bacterium]